MKEYGFNLLSGQKQNNRVSRRSKKILKDILKTEEVIDDIRKPIEDVYKATPELRNKLTIYDLDIVKAWFDHHLPRANIHKPIERTYLEIRSTLKELTADKQKLLLLRLRDTHEVNIETINKIYEEIR